MENEENANAMFKHKRHSTIKIAAQKGQEFPFTLRKILAVIRVHRLRVYIKISQTKIRWVYKSKGNLF